MTSFNKMTKPILILSVSGVILLTLIFAFYKDFLQVKRLRWTVPQPYYDSHSVSKYSTKRSDGLSSPDEEISQIKQTQMQGQLQYLDQRMDTPLKGVDSSDTEAEPDVVMTKPIGKTLTQKVINGVKTFVIFIGYSRSGSSIMSSFMDAHPHMVVSYQYGVFKDWNENLKNKNYLFNELLWKSQKDVESGMRSDSKSEEKNYTLHVQSLWQGKYDQYISLIGDKDAGQTVGVHVASPSTFIHRYKMLQTTVGIPVKAVFVVRNPFDIISTTAMYYNSKNNSQGLPPAAVTAYKSLMKYLYEAGNMKQFENNRLKIDALANIISVKAIKSKAIEDIIDIIGSENVWQVHNMDLVNDPKRVLIDMCEFFEIDCSPNYINTCAGMVFDSVSKTRELVVWPQKERQMVMEGMIRRFSFFNRYTFESE